jgi:hypothetical protein
MANQGDWGGGGRSNIPGTVKRTRNVTRNTTSTVSGPSFESSEEAPALKDYPLPQYDREPFDPEFKNVRARGNDKVRGSR